MLFDAIARPLAQLIEIPTLLGDADHGHVQLAMLQHRLKRRKDFFVRQISRGAKEDESVRFNCVRHTCLSNSPGVTGAPYSRPSDRVRSFQVACPLLLTA